MPKATDITVPSSTARAVNSAGASLAGT